jgi:hypothetical protein
MDEMKRSVGLYGSNLVMSAIATSLRERPQFQVHQFMQSLPEPGNTEADYVPDVVLFDVATAPADLVSLLRRHPKLTLIGVDVANSKMLMLSGVQSRLLTAEDLIRAIEGKRPLMGSPGEQSVEDHPKS